jgi:hypothetical protein
MDGCAQWHTRKDLLHEVQDTLSKAWLLTGIPERTELAKRDIPITGIRNGRSLADDVHAARVESHWRRFPLRNVARVWRHKLLRRQISRTNRKFPFKPNSGPVRYRRQPPSSNSSASFQVGPSASLGWQSSNRPIGLVKRTKGLRRKLTTPGGANGSVASWRSLRSPALRSIVCLADLGRRPLHLLVCPSLVPYRRSFGAENQAPNSKSAVAKVRPPRGFTGPWREDRKKLVGAPRFELGTPCTPCKCATRLRHAPTRLFFCDSGSMNRAIGDTARHGNHTPFSRSALRQLSAATPSTAPPARASPASRSAGSGSHPCVLPRQ